MPTPAWHDKARSLAAQGLSSREIADAVGMSIRQVQAVIRRVDGLQGNYKDRTQKAQVRQRPKFVSKALDEVEKRRISREQSRVGRPFLLKHSDKPAHKPTPRDERLARITRLLAVDACNRQRSPITLPRLSILEEAM